MDASAAMLLVRKLASREAPVAEVADWPVCTMCDVDDDRSDLEKPENHLPDCLWRRARELVAAE